MSQSTAAGVPLCDLNTQFRQLQPQIESAISRVLSSGQFILGSEVNSLEQELAQYCQAKYAIGCGSGSDALLLALAALDIGPGDEVIMPTFTFFATAGSVHRSGAKAVFVDIDPITYNVDPQTIEKKITSRTKAIMPVHLYGQTAEMEPLWDLAQNHQLHIIEDAAQAIGAEYQGRRTGTLGSIACFSFYPSKNLGTYGDAGLVTTDNTAWANKMKALRVHGMEPRYYHKYIGWNARIDAIHAAILRVKLQYLEQWNLARQQAAKRYDEMIAGYHLDRYMQRPTIRFGRRHVFNQYVIRVPSSDRDALVQHLKANSIGCEIYYPVPLHLQECMRHLGYQPGDFPISEDACKSVLALPMFPEITESQQQLVLDVCADFVRLKSRKAA